MAENVLDLLKSTGAAPRLASRGHKGEEYWSPCPGCGGDDRFHVWPDQYDGDGSWWCRGCDQGGDNIEFCRQFLGMDFKTACEHVGRDVPEYDRQAFYDRKPERTAARAWQPDTVEAPDGVDVERWRNKAAELVEKCHAALLESDKHLAYLAGRGIDRAAVERFQLGWLAGEGEHNCLFRPREAWGLPTITKENGRKKMLFIPRGLVIPYIVDGQVLRIRIRRPKADLKEGQPKYFNLTGSTMARTLINPDAKAFVVIEAELDAMAVIAAAGDIVGALAVGSSHAKPDAAATPALEQALRILVALDFDKAGAGAWPWWQAQFERAKRWPVPVGKDPGDLPKAGVDLRAWIMAGLPPAMTIGPSRFGVNEKRGGADVSASTDSDPGGDVQCEGAQPEPQPESDADQADGLADVPASIAELAGLLKQYPVRIINTPEQTGIREKQAMRRYPDVSKRISRLVYFDKACWAHIAAHPADVITGENFLGR